MKERITAAELKAMTMKELAAWVEFNACSINRTMVMSWGHEELFKGYHIRPEYIGYKAGRLIVKTFHFTSRTRKADAQSFAEWLHWAIFGEYPAEETTETAEQVEETETEDPEAVTMAPAEMACVWDENGETVTPDTDTEEEEEEQTMKPENKLYLSNWDYNAALIIEELAAIVENNGGTVKPGTETIIENRALNTNMRKAAARLEQLERIEAENPGTNEKRTEAMKRLRADIEKWERIDNSPRTVHHCTWSSAYISFKLGGMYYYYQTDSNPFFDFHYQKTPIDVNGTISRCACLENDPKDWLYDCFLRADATDADRREAANLIYNMLVKAAPSVIRRDSSRVRVRNQYDGHYHYETVYEKERREAVNF